MKLALYLPNFRDKVTVKELEDLTGLAEELAFDSVWTLDRIVVPEASDREELQYSFGMMEGFPRGLPVSVARRVPPGHVADPLACREDDEGADRHEHHRHAVSRTRCPRGGDRHRGSPLERQGQRRRRLRLDARGVRGRECRVTSSTSGTSTCARRSRSCRASGRTTSSSTTASSPTSTDVDSERSPCRSRTRRSSSAGSRIAKRSANRIAKYGLSGWIGIQDAPDELAQWRGAIQRELEELGSSRSVDDLEICSMLWFVITDEETDQTPQGKVSNLMAGTAAPDHRQPQALQRGRADDAPPLAAVPGCAGRQDAR